MKIRHLLEDHSDSELFWESMQDHGWKPVGEFLVSPDDDSGIAVGRNMHLYYRGVDTRIEYTDANYADLLRFEDDEDVQKKLYSLSNVLLNFASEAVQLAAVRQDGWVIKYIEDQSEAVQLAAVRQNGYAIQHIRDPSEAVQLAAVRQNAWLIGYIKSPSEMVKLVVMEQNRLTWFRSRPARDWTHRKRSKYLL
jgi:hypothetical protein